MTGSADETAAAGYRPLLFSIAYGMTGSVGDAEDIVQDAFLGLTRARQAGTVIADPKAYLTTAVTRLGINYLRSARVRRETYVGDWLPEPVVVPVDEPGPAEHAELADSLSMAFLVLLEALSPTERAVFMLREAFGYGYPEVARVTGKTEANCRQIFARARQRIAAGGQARDGVPAPARRAEGEQFARRFFEAAAGGDMEALLGMVAPDVVFHGDGGGKAQAIGQPMAGRDRVLRFLLGLFRRGQVLDASLRLAWVNGQPGAVVYDAEGRVISVFGLDIADGVVQAIRSVVNPDKLGHLGPVSDVARLPERSYRNTDSTQMRKATAEAQTGNQESDMDVPTYSPAERDRRWALAREIMAAEETEALIAYGGHECAGTAFAPDAYFSNDRPGSIVIFCRNADPVQLVGSNLPVQTHLEAARRGDQMWIDPASIRVGAAAAGIAGVLCQHGLEHASVGVLGLEAVRHPAMAGRGRRLPGVKFRPVGQSFLFATICQSREELAVVRYSGGRRRGGQTMLAAAAPGVSEADVYAAGMAGAFRLGSRPAPGGHRHRRRLSRH